MKHLTLVGECNRCGTCCVVNGYTCQHLLTGGRIGEPEATVCQVYTERYQGMPIMLISPDAQTFMVGHCSKDSQEETDGILARGIGHGCSLTVKEEASCGPHADS